MSKIEDLYARLPRLEQSSHTLTSEATDKYNCVAWLTSDMGRWWQPQYFWPPGIPEPESFDDDLDCYVALFESLGYVECDGPELEPGFLKIAIYAVNGTFHHVAKQVRSGAWSSKIGYSFDLRHDELEALYDAVFFEGATVTLFMRRVDDGNDRMEIEESEGVILPPGMDA